MPALVPPTPTSGSTTSTSAQPGETPSSSGELLPFPTNGSTVNGLNSVNGTGINGSPMSQAFPTSQPPGGSYMRSAVTLI